jgi:hypothetical protein
MMVEEFYLVGGPWHGTTTEAPAYLRRLHTITFPYPTFGMVDFKKELPLDPSELYVKTCRYRNTRIVTRVGNKDYFVLILE